MEIYSKIQPVLKYKGIKSIYMGHGRYGDVKWMGGLDANKKMDVNKRRKLS